MQYEVKNVKLEIHSCPKCGIVYAITENFENRKRQQHDPFYCPNGHSIWFPGKTDTEKISELNQCLSNCNSDKKKLFNEGDFFRQKIKQLKSENRSLKIVKSRYKNKLNKEN